MFDDDMKFYLSLIVFPFFFPKKYLKPISLTGRAMCNCTMIQVRILHRLWNIDPFLILYLKGVSFLRRKTKNTYSSNVSNGKQCLGQIRGGWVQTSLDDLSSLLCWITNHRRYKFFKRLFVCNDWLGICCITS